MKSTAFNQDALGHAENTPLYSIMLHGIHCLQSGCFWPCCIKSTAFNRDALGLTASTAEYNRDPLCHNAWSLLHSMTLHGIHCIQSGCFGPCCIKSTAFNHAAWNPLYSIGMHFTTLQGLHFIQSQCMESTAFHRDALGHAA